MKKITSILLILIFLISFPAHALNLSATGACTMDFETGEVFYEKNADAPMTPASLTKIMTLYIVYEEMEKGTLTPETLIPISYNAAHPKDPDATNIPLTVGELLPLSTLIDAMAIVSACGCCTAIAEYLSGSEDVFATRMNETAAQMGINAYFTDASGLSDYNLITPKGVATLIREFVKKHPQILEITKKQTVYIKGKKYEATNLLLPGGKKFYEGTDGFKTGTTTRAGKCIAATAQRGDTRIISVSMKSSTNALRYSDATALLDSAFARADFLNTNLFETDIRAFVNGAEIPCCYALGRKKALCITAENLNSYGFDTYYDAGVSILYIYENENKEITPLSITKNTAGNPLYKIYTLSAPKVVLVKDGQQINLETVFSLNGQCCISLDELGAHFSYTWDGENRTATLG